MASQFCRRSESVRRRRSAGDPGRSILAKQVLCQSQVASNPGVTPLTGPEMFCIEIPAFWIDREQSRQLSYRGRLDPLKAARMKYVDRLLVDFSWE
jgi:hypothetical protein